MDYTFLKSIHVAADFVWLAGLVLNGVILAVAARQPDRVPVDLLKHLRRWDLFVFNPAQGLVWIFGIWIAIDGEWYRDGWFMTKFVLVLILAGLHGSQTAALRKLSNGTAANKRLAMVQASAYVALAAALVISFLVIMKPF